MSIPYKNHKVSGQSFYLPNKYRKISNPIASGSIGLVVVVYDETLQRNVIIRKLSKAFEDTLDALRNLREIRLMKLMSHENIIKIFDLIPPDSTISEFNDIYIVQDYMGTDLRKLIYSTQVLSKEHIQYFIYQIFKAIKYMHSCHVVLHKLKPEDIYLNANCDLKIYINYDTATFDHPNEDKVTIDYDLVINRPIELQNDQFFYYKAPELMLGCKYYTSNAVMWSIGCLLAEMINRSPIFPSERNHTSQLKAICEKIGKPSLDDLDFITVDKAKNYILSLPDNHNHNIINHITSIDEHEDKHLIDLLKKLLEFNPNKRIKSYEALDHIYLSNLNDIDMDNESNFTIHLENMYKLNYDKAAIQSLYWDEIRYFHPNLPEDNPSISSSHGMVRDSSVFKFAAINP